jgi:hypothetical protein
MIYINPRKDFDEEHKLLAKIQIEQGLKFWKKEDIILITNFEYEYKGIKASIIDDSFFCNIHDKASKINTIIYLLEEYRLGEFVWFHDFDAFQLEPIIEKEINLGKADVGFTDYGWSLKWNTGSIFFKPSALGVFKLLKEAIYRCNTDEERALVVLTKNNIGGINSKIKRLNIIYNLGMRRINYNLERAVKPIKVVHFHPTRKDILNKFKPLITKDLIKEFEKYKFA